MSMTRTTADAVLKEFYLPAIRNQLQNEVFLLSQVEPNSEDIEGRRAVLALKVSRNHGIGARAEGGTLPGAGRQGYAEERVDLKYNYGRIQISGPVMRSMGSDRGSFTRAVTSETEGVVTDLKKDVNRQLFGTSNGVIATCGTTSSSTTVTLLGATAVQLRQLAAGMVIDIGTVANPVSVAEARTIVSVGSGSIVISGAAVSTTSGAAFIFRSGSGGAVGGAGQKEFTGLQSIVAASGALFNVDPGTHAVWASYVDANGGTNRSISEAILMRAQHEVQIRSGKAANLWVSSDGVQRATANLLSSLRRFNEPVQLKAGYQALNVNTSGLGTNGPNQVGMMLDPDCPANTAFLLNTQHVKFFRMSDWEFMEEDGAVLSRVPNQDAYEATLFCYAEQATDQRNAHARVSDITEA
jgi:hypothetical protein